MTQEITDMAKDKATMTMEPQTQTEEEAAPELAEPSTHAESLDVNIAEAEKEFAPLMKDRFDAEADGEAEDATADAEPPETLASTEDADAGAGEGEKAETYGSDTVARATALALDEEWLNRFASDDAAQRGLDAVESAIAKFGMPSEPETETAADPDAPAPKTTLDMSGLPEIMQQGLDPERTDEALVEYSNAQRDFVAGLHTEVQQMRQQMSRLLETEAVRAQQADVERFDSMIAGLGADYEPLFAKGTVNDITEGSTEYNNRARLFDQMAVLREGYRAKKLAVPGHAQLFNSALRIAFSKEVDASQRRSLKGAVDQRRSQALPRPGGPNQITKKPTGRDAAVEAVRAQLAADGIT